MKRLKDFLKRHWPRLRLRTVLFGAMLFVAALPLIGVIFFRVYETALVQGTETELIMQGAVFASVYARAVEQTTQRYNRVMVDQPPPPPASPRRTAPTRALKGKGRSARGRSSGLQGEVFIPQPPRIDILTDSILPPRPRSRPLLQPIDFISLSAGRAVRPIVLQATRTTLASVRILNAKGQVVSGRSEVGQSLAHIREVISALRGRAVSTLRRKPGYRSRYPVEIVSRAAGARVFHSVPVFLGNKVIGVVLLSRSPKSLFIQLYDNPGKVAFLLFLLLSAILAIAALLSRSITRPVALLVESTRKVARGDLLLPPPPPTAAVEIQELFIDIENMARTIDQRSNYIKNFAAAVSHEFKTPLSGISGAIELLQDHDDEMSEFERGRFLANVSQDARRLERLVSKLLQLARADVLLPGKERCSTGGILKVASQDFSAKGLKVDVVIPDGPCVAAISSVALETVLAVLLNNSLQHQASSVKATVTVQDGIITTVLADNGTGVAVEDRERIFTPFFTTRRGHGGTGLGLSIAQSLTSAYGGKIILGPSKSGAVFEVRLRHVG